MDAARSAMRLGAEHVYIVYRRSMDELPARKEEVHHAQEEGIEFLVLNNPVKIVGDENGHVKGMECIKMELGEPDASGRRRPIPIEGSNFILDVALSLTRTSQQLRKAFTQAATLLQALLLLSSLWVQAKRLPLLSTSISRTRNNFL